MRNVFKRTRMDMLTTEINFFGARKPQLNEDVWNELNHGNAIKYCCVFILALQKSGWKWKSTDVT